MDSTRSEYARHLEYIEEIESAAHVTALSTRLPWLLLRLREVGYQAVSRALIDGGQHTSGQERPDYVKDRIRQEIRRAAGKLISADAQPEDIVCALGTFTTKEWETLIAGFGSDDLDLLRQYLDAHKGFLESDLGRRKYLLIYGDAIKRVVALWARPGMRMTEISAPVQAVQLWRRYRQLNARRLPVPEDRYYAISQVLGRNWTRRRVQLMLDRLREDEGIKAFLDRDGPEPYLKGDAHGDLLYWSKGRYVRQRHERRQDRDGE